MTDPLTLADAARLLDICEEELAELVDAGVLPVSLLGGDRRIATTDLASYRRRRDRARAGIERLADVVNESEGGWVY